MTWIDERTPRPKYTAHERRNYLRRVETSIELRRAGLSVDQAMGQTACERQTLREQFPQFRWMKH